MTHASLFSGIGGAELAATWAGWQNLFHCEINPFCRRVLEYWYPDSTSYEDITKTDFSGWRGRVGVLTAGFPCQPFSVAGQRKGAGDDRYLWPQVVRAVHEIRPAWVVGENVAGLLSMVQPGQESALGSSPALFQEGGIYRTERQYVVETVCQDLEREGYSVQPFVVPACAVGAPHRRDRLWIVAHRADARPETLQRGGKDGVHAAGAASDTDLNRRRERTHQQVTVAGCKETSYDCACCEDGPASHPGGAGREERHPAPEPGRPGHPARTPGEDLPALRWAGFPSAQPALRGGHDGLPFPVDRLAVPYARWRRESVKAYGNALVPQVAYEIFRAIQQAENEQWTNDSNTPPPSP